MFDGHIICRSKQGAGSNFVFIVALGTEHMLDDKQTTACRMLNPIQQTYNKLSFVKQSVDENGNICSPRQMESAPINVFEEM